MVEYNKFFAEDFRRRWKKWEARSLDGAERWGVLQQLGSPFDHLVRELYDDLEWIATELEKRRE